MGLEYDFSLTTPWVFHMESSLFSLLRQRPFVVECCFYDFYHIRIHEMKQSQCKKSTWNHRNMLLNIRIEANVCPTYQTHTIHFNSILPFNQQRGLSFGMSHFRNTLAFLINSLQFGNFIAWVCLTKANNRTLQGSFCSEFVEPKKNRVGCDMRLFSCWLYTTFAIVCMFRRCRWMLYRFWANVWAHLFAGIHQKTSTRVPTATQFERHVFDSIIMLLWYDI